MKITGSRWELQIEDDNGNVAGFSGEACPGEFLADAASLCWIRHKGEAAQGDGMDLIRRVTEYTKDSSCRVLFFDADQKILFEDELELKTEAYLSKTYLIFLAAVVVPLAFVAALLTMLDEIDRMVRLITDLVMLLAAMPFLFLMLRGCAASCGGQGSSDDGPPDDWQDVQLSCIRDHEGDPESPSGSHGSADHESVDKEAYDLHESQARSSL